jgi:AbrB family looped-hinge helix DNA binding protein
MQPTMAVVSSKGQLVIPKEIRDALDIGPGTRVAMTVENGRILLQPANRRLVDELCGITAGGPSMADELIAERRAEERRRDEVLGM